jgi:F-type H+-transporting ATPase subunit a
MASSSDVAHSTAEHAPTSSEYIVHHLTHWNSLGKAQEKIVDFSVINYDSVIISVVLGVLVAFIMWSAAKAVTSGVPGRFVGAIESLVGFVHEQARSIVKGDISFIAPMALTSFVWIFAMNAMDFLPLDFMPRIWEWFYSVTGRDPSHAYLRVVPTADLNATLSMSLFVLCASIYYGIKIKHAGHFVGELFSAPFGSPKNILGKIIMGVINFSMQMIEYIAKTVSLGMRLFGNMFAGELVFMLIALMGGAFALNASGLLLGAGHILAGTAWAIFHILIVLLQAFIFMMLTLVYIGQAHEAH